MSATQSLQRVRQRLSKWLGSASEGGVSESILVRDDIYYGHRFRCGAYVADWVLGEAIIRVSCNDQVIKTIDLMPENEARAA